MDLGLILMTFCALGTALKLDDFPCPLGCAAEIRAGGKWTLILVFLGQSDSIAADSKQRQFRSRQHGEYKDTGQFHIHRSLVPL